MLYLVRHCSTEQNESNILCSDTDANLSEKGVAQALKLSKWFADKKIDLILTSDLKRAIQTANLISKVTDTKIIKSIELRERHVAETYVSLRPDELDLIRNQNGHQYIDATQDWNNVEDVESDSLVYLRTKRIITQHLSPSINLICITHAGVIKSFLHSILKIDKSRTNGFIVKNGCIVELSSEKDFDLIRVTQMLQLG